MCVGGGVGMSKQQLTWSIVAGTGGAEGGVAMRSGPDVTYIIFISSAGVHVLC